MMNQKIEKPITYDELYEKIKKIIKKQDELDIINNAYAFALNKHAGKKRRNGDDYVTHPLEVANILTDLNVDYVTLASSIIHETVNHSDATIEEVKEEFGEEIATIVHSLSKINRLELSDDKDSSAAYLRKVLVGLSEDVRVLFIKLADRLHNMRTLDALTIEEQKQKANETTSVLIPIAHRLGINSIKSELEDLCLKYEPNTEEGFFEDTLQKANARDMKSGTTSVGPHRDDMLFSVGNIDIRKFGSQGQQRTSALSLKLSEIELVKRTIHDTPVLLLDDVLSELDSNRQNYLLNSISDIQTLITCTGLDEFVKNQFQIHKTFEVIEGSVTERHG